MAKDVVRNPIITEDIALTFTTTSGQNGRWFTRSAAKTGRKTLMAFVKSVEGGLAGGLILAVLYVVNDNDIYLSYNTSRVEEVTITATVIYI